MTVCIAALYDNGKGCVLASDQMITAHFPIGYEFERSDVGKIIKYRENVSAFALIAGDVLFSSEVIDETRKQLDMQGFTAVENIAEVTRITYQCVRIKRITRHELEPRGLDIETYYQKHLSIYPQVIQLIDNALTSYNPGAEFIIAGKNDTGYRLFTVVNPGDITCHDSIGYTAIGSGAPHAIYSMIESGYKSSLDKVAVEQMVRKAKERSEVAPGVGHQISVEVIS